MQADDWMKSAIQGVKDLDKLELSLVLETLINSCVLRAKPNPLSIGTVSMESGDELLVLWRLSLMNGVLISVPHRRRRYWDSTIYSMRCCGFLSSPRF